MSTESQVADRRSRCASAGADLLTGLFDRVLDVCDSPIEKLLIAEIVSRFAIDVVFNTQSEAHAKREYDIKSTRLEPGVYARRLPRAIELSGATPVYAAAQFPVPSKKGRTYRIDFAFIVDWAMYWDADEDGAPVPEPAWVAVECDGHDFHERTKEQARADRSRDRHLTELGWTVVRFTGSELVANISGCVDELLRILESTKPKRVRA